MYAFWLNKGITWEGIVPGNPQMNGKSERLGQTIQQKASAMLKESQLPQNFWTEFVRTSNHLRNLQPVSNRDITPYEAYTGRPPDLSHLRIIGQIGYCQVHLGNTGWFKYQDRAHKGKLVGYQANRFYRMLMSNGKVEVFSNVQWINNVPLKPIIMELTPSGVQQANTTSLPETRNKRRNDAIADVDPAHSVSFSGESAPKRRRQNSVEVADSTVPVAKQYLTAVRIPLAKPTAPAQVPSAQPTRIQPPRGARGDLPRQPSAPPVPSPPRAASGESSGLSDPLTESESEPPDPPRSFLESSDTLSNDTLSNNTLTPSTVSENPGTMPTTRSMSDRELSGKQQPMRHEILRAHRDLSPDPLSLLAKANAPEPYEPQTYKEAMADDYMKMHWELAMQEEVDSLITNETWSLVDLPSNAHVLGGRWDYKMKRGPQGEVARYKARWVVRGFEQREGIDFNETFASVVKPISYKAIFALAAALDWELEQMDVKTVFLYGNVKETIYVTQPTGFETGGKQKVCKPKKALYGLKRSPRVWYNTLAAFLKEQGFYPIVADYSVFSNDITIIAIYVDDILLVGPDKKEIQRIKDKLHEHFEITDLSECNYYLGITVTRDRVNRILRLGQAGYVQKFITEYGMWEFKGTPTPMGIEKY